MEVIYDNLLYRHELTHFAHSFGAFKRVSASVKLDCSCSDTDFFCTYVVWLRLCSWNQDTGTQKTHKTERKAIKDFDLAWAWTRVWFRFDVVPFLNKDFTYVFIIFSWASANVCVRACVRVYVEVHKASNWFHRLLFLWTLNPFPMLVNNMEKYRDIFFAWIHFVLCLESGFYHFEIFQESQVNLFR